MESNYGKKWTREETILAFDLYCKMPFSKISKTNKEVIALAEILGRTPSSVGLKMSNLAHFDPELAARNIRGMANGSKLDKAIVDEFNDDWEELSYQAEIIRAGYMNVDIKTFDDKFLIEEMPSGYDVKRVIKTRVGQMFFRSSVMSAYDNTCCITGVKNSELLNASHIKPWKDSDSKTERTNPRNGLCLNALHDRAFDRGFITLDCNYRVIISKRLSEVEMDKSTYEWFYSYENETIRLPDKFYPRSDFIEYHNDVIFKR